MKSESDRDFSEVHFTSGREITWNVRNLLSVGLSLDSPPFVFQNAVWCLRVYPSVGSDIGLMIERLRSLVPRHKLKYSLKLKDDKITSCDTADFDEDHKEAGDMHFVSRFYGSLNSENKNCWFRRESIHVTCEISCNGLLDAADGSSQTDLSMEEGKDLEALCQDFKNMLLNGENQDVVLKVKEKEFGAHRDVLRARCPVFRCMLSHDMTEMNGGVIDIPDCDPSAFEQFLLYLYGGEVDTLDAENMLSLYYITDKYDAGRLKEKCREFIKKSLSTRNITDVVQIALDHSDENLLRRATDYFVKEVKRILPTVEWMSFVKRNPVPANELFMKAAESLPDSKDMAE